MSTLPKRKSPPSKISQFFKQFEKYDLNALFDPARPKPFPRTVLVNVSLPPHALEVKPVLSIPGTTSGIGSKNVGSKEWIFESNQVITSKYNILTYLPRNLLEQFRRVANVFFLGE